MSRRTITGAHISRRSFCGLAAGVLTGAGFAVAGPRAGKGFRIRRILASSLYGHLALEEVLKQASDAACTYIDIWPERHANHREQAEAMGHEKFREMLARYGLQVGILTHYDLGPFALDKEMSFAHELGVSIIACGSRGPAALAGADLRNAVGDFVEKTKPHVAVAEKMGVTIAVENHANSLIASPDSIRWFADMIPSQRLGIALAPYHLPQDETLIADLIDAVGGRLVHFYGWQYGMGCSKPLPEQQQLLQMPGRGGLNFAPIIAALRRAGYEGWTEVFMHPFPRGIPVLPTAHEVTAEVNRAYDYLEAASKPSSIRN